MGGLSGLRRRMALAICPELALWPTPPVLQEGSRPRGNPSTANPSFRVPPAAGVERGEAAGPRAVCSLRAGWRRLIHVARRLDDSWVGDLVGVICLFAGGYMLMFLGFLFE